MRILLAGLGLFALTACGANVDVFGGGNTGGDAPQPTGANGSGGVPGDGGAGPSGGAEPSGGASSPSSNSSTGTGMGCMSGPNDDFDQDGFSPSEGDCNDCDSDLSPNNLEISGNAADEDCDGRLDNVLDPCDEGLLIDEEDAFLAASAIELCREAKDTKLWGLVAAAWVMADGTPPPAPQAAAFHLGHGLLEDFGQIVEPRAGVRLLALSNANARDEGDPDYQAPDNGGGKGYSSAFPPGAPMPSAGCTNVNVNTLADPVALEVVLRTPDNALGIEFDSNFYAADWPAYVCTGYDDAFFAFMAPTPPGLANGQVAFYANGNGVSLNGAPFDVCSCKAPPCMAGGQAYACSQGESALLGTGFQGRAATGWQTTTVSVSPGSEITLRLGVYDAGDNIMGATALVDAFRFSTTAVTVTTVASP